ncbi:HEAT repeat-containing protein 1 [Podochytrium sp. JEL0797]|nr:HEAT repeat-containing protein 1 [Podochytrium sp. JEL0797]
MSSLAAQLGALSASSSGAKNASKKGIVSLLFANAADASDLDIDAFFSIGCNGLAGLISLSPSSNFEQFSDSLFSETLKNQDRMLLSKDENASLDKLINKFLTLVSPHILHTSSFKALEWLIKRFRINEFNIDSFVRCALPFHDTWQFTRVLGTIKLSGRWAWLAAQKEKKVSLDRGTLVYRITTDIALLEFVCEMMEKLIIPGSTNASLCSFFTGTMVEFISTVKFTDNMMRILMPCLFAMAATSIPNVQAASYMTMSHLSNHIPLSAPVVGALTDVVLEKGTAELAKFAACCLVSVYDAQENCPSISKESMTLLLAKGSFWKPVFAEVLGVYQGDDLTLKVVTTFFELRKQGASNLGYGDFVDFIKSLSLSAPLAEALCSLVLEGALSGPSQDDAASVKQLLVFISKSFPLVVNRSIASISASTKKNAGTDKLFDLVSTAFVGTAHEPLKQTNTTLYLSLQHADDEVRFIGYERLVKIITSTNMTAANAAADKDFSFVPQALASGLVDVNAKIRALAVSVPNLVEFLRLLPDGIQSLYDLSVLVRLSNLAMSRHVFDHVLKLDFAKDAEASDLALSYFFMGKETVGAFVHASAAMAKHGPAALRALVSGSEALGKEIQQAEKSHKGKGAEFEKVLEDVFGRTMAVIAANVVKDESNAALDIMIAALSSDNQVTRLLALAVLSKIVESPQYGSKNLVVSNALLHHFKNTVDISKLPQDIAVGVSGTSLISLKPAGLAALEDSLLLATLSVIVDNLPVLRKHEVVPTIDYAKGAEKDVFEVLMTVRGFKSCQKMVGNFFSSHLKGNSMQFLAGLSLAPKVSDTTKAQALRMIFMLLNAETEAKLAPKDYQVLIPVLLVGLSRHSKVVREQAIKCLTTIKQIQGSIMAKTAPKKAAASIFAFDTFYGSSSNKVKFLHSELTTKFVGAILETAQELISDASYVFRMLGDILFKKSLDHTQSENVLTFLLTTVLALDSPHAKFDLLNTLQAVIVPQKVKILQPLFDTVFGNGEVVKPCSSDDELALRFALIDCFDAATIANVFSYRSGRFLSLFVRIVSTGDEREALHALALVDPVWFANSASVHQHLFSALVQIASKASKDVALAAKRAIKEVEVSSEVVLNVILACKASIGETDDEQQAKRSRSVSDPTLAGISELISVLELLDSTSNITGKSELVGPLFELLGFVLPLDSSRVLVSLEYLKQLLITALLSIIRTLKEAGQTVDENVIRVDLIVSCIRVSDNPQTHNEALLLLAELAEAYPNTVLVNVVPIFTFMGANVLRRDDDYSFHVIQQTLKAIIPPLIKKSKSATKKLDVRSIIEVFIDSIFHIPRHRRLRLFTILVSTLGPVEYLDSVIMMLLLKSSQRFSDIAMVNPSDIAMLSPFCLSLVQQFDALVQFQTIDAITESIQILSGDAESQLIGSVALDVRSFAPNEIRHFKLICLDFVNNSLGAFASGEQSSEGTDTEEQDVLFHNVFQTSLLIIVDILGTKSLKQAEESKNAFFRSVSKRLNSILAHLNHLMSFASFFELALSLLEHDDLSIRVRVTDLTKTKLVEVDAEIYQENKDIINAVFKELSAAVAVGESVEHTGLKIASFECINSMIVKFAAVEPQVFAAVLPILTEDGILASESRQIRLASLECIGSCISTLGPRLIPYIKKIMTGVFDILKQLGQDLAVDQLCVVALNVADLAISVMPQFLSPFIQEILQSMFLPYDQLTGSKEILNKFRNTKRDISTNISKKIPVRTLIPILSTQVSSCFKLGVAATLELFEVTSMTISNMEKGDLVVFLNDLVKFFLSSFEFRKKHHAKFSESEIDKVESAIISAFLQLVLRLNESHFKPMFFKIVDWAFNATGGKENVLFLYRLVVNLLDKLKTIFSPYVLHLVDHSIELLASYKSQTEVDKRWELVMQSLNKFLQYSSGPVSEDVFNKLSKCLTGQIDLVSVHGRNYLTNMNRYVVPTIGLLAVNIAKEPMWKILNKEIMKKSRNDDVLCRIITAKALQEFYVHLGEEFLILLPETVPTIAELMEDGDERVQIACQELTAEIQKHLGEDLNSYFS